MVAKGHHFAGVELAAVIDADSALSMPDFRAEERTFQLITQLAGRSGRDAPGRVIVQTFQPDARPIAYAARHDVRRFLDEELERRRDLGYPPERHLVRIVVSGPDPGAGRACACRARGRHARGRAARPGAAPAPPPPPPRRSSQRRPTVHARSQREPRPCSPPRRRRCAAPGSTAVVDVDPQ